MTNQLETQMTRAALDSLIDRDPREIAEKAGAACMPGQLTLPFFGKTLTIRIPGWEISPALPFWERMAVLHYLACADGTPLTGRWMPFGQMPGGLARGGGIDRQWERKIAAWSALTPEVLEGLCAGLGGETVPSPADAAWYLPVFPRFPVLLQAWFADEEFPASGRLLVEKSAGHYLTIEDAVVVSDMLLARLEENFE